MHGVFVGHVRRKSFDTRVPGQGFELFLLSIRDNHIRALFNKCQRDRTPQAACTAGHQNCPARKSFAHLINVPRSSSAKASCSSCCVFITIGPPHATGSSSGLPETSRNRIPSAPASTTTSSPRSKRTSDRFPACVEEFPNDPAPWKT